MKEVFVRDGERLRYSCPKGYIVEKAKEHCFRVARYSKVFEDGFVGDAIAETKVNYKTGLYQYSDSCGYSARYFDEYKGKRNAMKVAKRALL